MYRAKSFAADCPSARPCMGASVGVLIEGRETSDAASEGEWVLAQIAQNACAPPTPLSCDWPPDGGWVGPSSHTCADCAALSSTSNKAHVQVSCVQARVFAQCFTLSLRCLLYLTNAA